VRRFLQPLTALLEGRAPQASCALKPEASSGLLQASPPYPRGGLRWYRVFLMLCPICNYVHKIVLQFYVYFFAYFNPHVVSLFLSVPLLVQVVQSYRRRVCFRYLRLIWGPLIIFLLGV
jgi:hypothetical protein